MPNTLGTLASDVIIQRALDLVFTVRPELTGISLDLSTEEVKLGKSVISRILSVPPVEDFGTPASARADSDVIVEINRFKQVYHKFTPAEYSGTSRNLIEESAEPIARAIANHMVDEVAKLWTEANFPNATVEAVADVKYDTLVTMREALVSRGAPAPYTTSVNAAVYRQLLKDSIVVANPATRAESAASGQLPFVAGFKIYEYPGLPTAGNLIGFAGSKDCVVLAARVPRDPRELLPNAPFPGNLGVVTNPATGLSVMVNEWIDPLTLEANVRVVWMYGVAVGNANNGQRLVSA